MIALSMIAIIFAYVSLSKYVIRRVDKKYGTKKAKNIALAIMILIPTWDIILGYPIYAFLCLTQSGVHIYKTVDNVEGFYVGEKSLSSEPIKPYKGYKYIDYKQDGKYYRSYWADYLYDREVASMCVYPLRPYSKYAKVFKTGKCIVKKEISEGEVSRWFVHFDKYKIALNVPLLRFRIYRWIEYKDRKTGKIMADAIEVWWQGGWVYGILSSIEVGSGGVSCDGNLDFNKLRITVFKPKKEK